MPSVELERPPLLPPRRVRSPLAMPPVDDLDVVEGDGPKFSIPLRAPAPSQVEDEEQISLYVCRRPGSDDILVTPTKPAQGGITDFDVKYGAYILQYDDANEYREAVEDFNVNKASLPTRAIRRQSRPVIAPPLSDISNAKRIEPETTALDKLLQEAQRQAEAPVKTNPLQGLRARGDSLQQWAKPREAKLCDAYETRNFHQMPLAARGLIDAASRPMTLLRIGCLPGQSKEIGEVAHMLDNHSAQSTSPKLGFFSSRDADEAAGYIDLLEEAYEPFGTDVNYVSPSWMKTFTRRLSRWKGHVDEEFTMLSPWQGTCIFVPSRARNTIKCYHTFSTVSSERVLVSELRLNVFPPASRLARRNHQARAASSDSGDSADTPLQVKRGSGSFPPLTQDQGICQSISQGQPTFIPTSNLEHSAGVGHFTELSSSPENQVMSSFKFQSASTSTGRSRASSGSTLDTDKGARRGLHIGGMRKRVTSDDGGPSSRVAAVLDRLDLSLGQERLGGGLLGRDVKLAKIVIFGPGQQFLDLLVAANMLLFNRAWQLSKHD